MTRKERREMEREITKERAVMEREKRRAEARRAKKA